MTHLRYTLILLAFVAFAIAGCENEEFDHEDGSVVELPTHGYILFNTEMATRGTLISDMNRDFGVMGYSWDYASQNDVWNTVKVQAKPDVFCQQLVTYADNSHTYDATATHGTTLVPWDGKKKYTFFGYYPLGVDAVVPSDSVVEGTPYIDYTLPAAASNMQDVMTAAIYNTDYRSAREVALHFMHRLAAIDLQMVNMNAPHNGNDVYIRVSNLSISLSNLMYEKARIWMDESMPLERTEYANKNKSYSLKTGSFDIEPSTISDINIVTSGNPLIVIPQEAHLTGTISFTLDYVQNGAVVKNNVLNQMGVTRGARTIDFTIDTDLQAGRKHVMQITFTRDAVTIQIIPPSEWEDKNVDIEFE